MFRPAGGWPGLGFEAGGGVAAVMAWAPQAWPFDPPMPPPGELAAAEPEPAAQAAPRRVLLVEDDPASRRAMRLLLKHSGWDVLAVATVGEAIAHLAAPGARGLPQWVVLDLMLPDGDGSAVLRYIRGGGLPIRVTVTTGVSDPVRLAEVQRLQPQSLLRKPIDLDDLMNWA